MMSYIKVVKAVQPFKKRTYYHISGECWVIFVCWQQICTINHRNWAQHEDLLLFRTDNREVMLEENLPTGLSTGLSTSLEGWGQTTVNFTSRHQMFGPKYVAGVTADHIAQQQINQPENIDNVATSTKITPGKLLKPVCISPGPLSPARGQRTGDGWWVALACVSLPASQASLQQMLFNSTGP